MGNTRTGTLRSRTTTTARGNTEGPPTPSATSFFSNRYLPIFFHNLKGYDSHHILRAAIDIVDKDKINVIPQSTEKFMTFSIGNLKFLDTAQFMPESLEKLAENLKTNSQDRYEKFKNMKQHFNEVEMKLICQKGV